MSSRGSFFLALSQFARISSFRSPAHSLTNLRALPSRPPARDPAGSAQGRTAPSRPPARGRPGTARGARPDHDRAGGRRVRLFVRSRLIEAAREQADEGLAGRWRVCRGGHEHRGRRSLLPAALSRDGFTPVSHISVMEWAAVIRDIVIGLLIAGERVSPRGRCRARRGPSPSGGRGCRRGSPCVVIRRYGCSTRTGRAAGWRLSRGSRCRSAPW